MRIITNFEALDMDEELVEQIRNGIADMEEIREVVFGSLESDFDDATSTSDAYLSDDYSEDDFTFGILNRDALISIAKTWNPEIKEQFAQAIKKVWNDNMTAEQLRLDTSDTYEVSCAARELDNHWWYGSNHGVYLPNECGYPYFKVILSESVMKDILRSPEQYIVIDVYVKY